MYDKCNKYFHVPVIGDLGECDERIKQPSGFIHSPDLDNDGEYETYQNCLFTIIAPELQVIYMMFTEFDIEFSQDCGYDFVDIREVCFLFK